MKEEIIDMEKVTLGKCIKIDQDCTNKNTDDYITTFSPVEWYKWTRGLEVFSDGTFIKITYWTLFKRLFKSKGYKL